MGQRVVLRRSISSIIYLGRLGGDDFFPFHFAKSGQSQGEGRSSSVPNFLELMCSLPDRFIALLPQVRGR